MIVGRKYSTVKKLVDEIERFKLIRTKVKALQCLDLRGFTLQDFDGTNQHEMSIQCSELLYNAEHAYINSVVSAIDAEIGEKLMKLEVVPDEDNEYPTKTDIQ